jgi:hypothetical protein
MDNILVALVTATACVTCFIVGAKVGQKVIKGVEIEFAKPDPLKAIRDHREKQKADEEQERLNTIMQNIENYDGTANGQKKVP